MISRRDGLRSVSVRENAIGRTGRIFGTKLSGSRNRIPNDIAARNVCFIASIKANDFFQGATFPSTLFPADGGADRDTKNETAGRAPASYAPSNQPPCEGISRASMQCHFYAP